MEPRDAFNGPTDFETVFVWIDVNGFDENADVGKLDVSCQLKEGDLILVDQAALKGGKIKCDSCLEI